MPEQLPPALDIALTLLGARFHERVVAEARERRKQSEGTLAARGLGDFSGSFQSTAGAIYQQHGRELTREIDLFVRDAYPSGPPSEVVDALARRITTALEQTADALADLATPAGDAGATPSRDYFRREAAIAGRDLRIVTASFDLRNWLRKVAAGRAPSTESPTVDVFISHASEDKAAVARPLADALRRLNLRVWLDESQLHIGDRLFDKIDHAIGAARFGVVILSRNFFAKNWPRRELAALAALEDAEGHAKILPVWHEIESPEVALHSPLLAAIVARRSSDGIERIAEEIASLVAGGAA